MIVSAHAAERYIQRVDPRLDVFAARAALQGYARSVDAAARFGCDTVRIGCGARLVLDGEEVVTVLASRKVRRGRGR